MSTTIDERVVEMRFDNKHFEANVQTSISTLDKLKQSLDLNGAAKGLENINDAAKKCDMSTLEKSVETVKLKFSALEVMAMTALANITNSALNAGKRLASTFTVEPITTGFNEYELKMGSIQTIMAGTGESLDRVNQKLDELNTYSDKTIYSFADMTQNIGKFTNAGVKLDDAVAAIQGVANVAAVSGANANEASRAMYNFGQALSAGYVKLIDWKSIENANMATVEFKQQLMDTAVEMGTLVKVGEKYQSTTTDLNGHVSDLFNSTLLFNDSLSSQWMTTEVLSKTLARYADETTEIGKKAFAAAQDVKTFTQLMDTLKESAQSGWATSWQIMIGDFEEAKELFTEMSEFFGGIISNSADARNDLLKGGLSSNWSKVKDEVSAAGISLTEFQDKLIEVGKQHGKITDEMITEAGSFEKSLKSGWLTSDIFSEAIRSFIGEASSFTEATGTMTNKLEEFDEVVSRVIKGDFGNGADRVKALTDAGYDYATVQGLVNQKLLGVEVQIEELSDTQLKNIGYTDEQIETLRKLAEQAEQTGTPLNELIQNLDKPSGRELLIDSARNALKGLVTAITAVHDAWTDIFPPLTGDQLYSAISMIHEFSKRLVITEETADKLKRTFKGLFAIVDIFTTLTGGALKAAIKVASRLLGMVDVDILDITANVGDAIVAFRDWIDEHNFLAKGIEKALPYLESGIKTFRNWVSSLGELPLVQKAVARFGDAFRETSERFGVYMQGGIERINAFIERAKAMDSLSLDNIKKLLVDFRDNVLGYFLNFGGIFDGLIQALKDFGSDVHTAFDQVTGGADQAKAKMKTTLGGIVQFFLDMKNRIFDIALEIREKLADKIGFGEIFALGLGAAMVAFTKKISDALGTIAGPFEGIEAVLKSASKALNAFAMETKSKALLNVAEAIAVLVGALAVLTLLDQEKLKGAMVVLGILAAGLLAVSFAMSKMGDPKELVKLSVSIVAVGSSLLLLANAMKTLESLDSDKTGGSLAILGILAAGLVAVSKLLSSKDKLFSSGAVLMVSFALSLKILAGALKDLNDLDIDNMGQTVTLLLGIVGSLALVAAACKNVKFGAAATVLAIVISLKLLAGCFKDIAKIDIGKAKSSIGTFVAIFGMFGALMVSSKFAGENASKAGTAILKMSAALILITTAFKMMAGIDPLDLDRATDTVTKLLLVFSAVTAASHFAGKNASKAGSMLLLMSGAILILSTTMVVLAHLDPSGLDRALGAITTLLLVFGAMMGITYFAKDSSKVQGTLITLTVAVSAMVAAIAALSLLDPERLKGATVAISSLVTVFSLLVASTHFAKKAGGTLVVMTGVVAGLAGILTMMSVFNVQNAIDNAAALSILLTSMSASLLILGKMGTIAPTAYASIGIMTAVVAGLAVILGVMDGLGVTASIETAASLSILLLSMSGACLILAGVGATGPAAFVGLGALGTLIVGLGAIMAAICALTADNPTVEEDLDRAIMVMEKIGTGLGAAIGGFVGGAIGGLSSGLPIIGTNLAQFMTNAQPFFDAVKGVDGEAMSGVKSLAETLLILTGVNVAEGLTSWLTGGTSLAAFGDELIAFAPKFVEYSRLMEGIKPEVIDASSNAAKTLAEFASAIPNQGGVLANLVGDNTLSTFAAELIPFGESFSKYAQSIEGINAETVAASANAAKSLAEFATAIPNQGGVLADLVGDNTLSSFAQELALFGPSLKSYANSVTGLEPSIVENSANAAKSLAEMANCLPNSGGILAEWMGDNTLSSFADELDRFGPAMMAYANSVTGLPTDVIEASVSAAGALAALAEGLPNQGGLVAWFKGDNKLSTFGEELISFGNNLSAYSTAISGMKPDAVVASANAAQALSNLATGLPDSSLFDQWFGGDQTLATFGNDIAKFGDSMSDYYAAISAIDLSKMDGVVTAVWSLVDLAKGVKDIDKNAFSNFSSSLSSLASTGITGFTTAFYNCDSEVTSAVVSMLNTVGSSITENASIPNSSMQAVVTSLVEVIKTKTTDVGTATTSMMSAMSTKITSYTVKIKTAMGVVVSAAVSKINELKPQFELAGKNAGQGFVNGINAKMSASSTAGRNLGLAALNASKKALDSHSPSREYIHLGENIGAGLAIGVKNSIVPASQAASGMIDEVIAVSSKGIDAFEKWAEEKKYYGELSLKDELAGYENLQQKYKAGSEERIKIDREVYRIQNELVSATYQASMDWIEEEKYYNRLSLEEELAAYERVQARYLEGSEERKKADREVYRLRNELVDASYQNSMDWIEKEKYYNRMSLSDELAAYKRVQSRYAKGTEEREKMDREVYRVEKEIYEAQKQYIADVQSAQASANQKRLDLEQEYADKVKSINDKLASDIQSLNDQYQSAVESRTKSLYQSYGLFDAVKEREEVSGETLMKNLEGQVQEFGQWQDILDSLSARGLDSELIGELQEMGPSAIAELKALNSMSDSELEKYASLWSIKHAQAREQAVSELEGLRIETQNNIAQLRVEADQELEEYRAVWQQKMDQVTIDVNAELEQLRKDFGEKVGLIKTDTEKEMQEMADVAQAILQEAGWDETGKQIVTGITGGVESEKTNFLDALTQMALEGVQAVKDTLEINSPSRVFRELGNYTGLGFVGGLKDYAGKSYDAGANMAESAKSGLSNAISMVAELTNGNFDMQPTIRPVLDLSDVTRGAGQLNSLFYPQKTMGLVGQASLAFNSTMDKDGMTVTVDNDGVVQELRSLRSEMAEMTTRLERMQVVLDTGTLVGELADPMDSALGQKQIHRGRGI